MNNQQPKNSIVNNVLERIKSGRIKMRPKIYFILKAVFWALAVFSVVLFILYLVSFIVFTLRASGTWFLPGFGFAGIRILFGSLPWLLILAAVILIIALEIFAKRFAVVYRRPILYSILIIIVFVLLGSFIIGETQFHPNLLWKAQDRRLPAIESFYRDYGTPRLQNVHFGIVSEIIDNGFTIETPRGEALSVVASSTDIKMGDTVVILGERRDGTVQAFDIRKTEKDLDIFPPNRFPGYRTFHMMK